MKSRQELTTNKVNSIRFFVFVCARKNNLTLFFKEVNMNTISIKELLEKYKSNIKYDKLIKLAEIKLDYYVAVFNHQFIIMVLNKLDKHMLPVVEGFMNVIDEELTLASNELKHAFNVAMAKVDAIKQNMKVFKEDKEELNPSMELTANLINSEVLAYVHNITYEYLIETYKIHDIKFDLHNVIKCER